MHFLPFGGMLYGIGTYLSYNIWNLLLPKIRVQYFKMFISIGRIGMKQLHNLGGNFLDTR